MKKKLLFLAITIFSIALIYNNVTEESATEKLRKQHADFLKSHPYNQTLELTKSERKAKGIPPNNQL